jgi:hypothetical protein
MGNCENQCLNKKSNLLFEIEKSKIMDDQKVAKFSSLVEEKENNNSQETILSNAKKVIHFENGCVYEGDWDEINK